MRFYKPRHFQIRELVPPDVYLERGDGAIILFDSRILWTLDALRDVLAVPLTVNTWHSGGAYTQRGYRTDPDTGARYSQHRFGRAVDFTVSGMTAQTFRDNVRSGDYPTQLQYITRIEDGVSWVHLDCASVPGTEIEFFHA